MLEGDLVVLAYRTSDLVVDPVGAFSVHPLPHPPLEGILRNFLIWRPTVGAAFWPPATFHWRKIADRVPDRHLVRLWRWPSERGPVAERDEDQPLPELGDPVLRGVHNALLDCVAEAFQLVNHGPQYEHVFVKGHVRHILHEHGRWLGDHYDLEEGPPQMPTFFRRIGEPVQDPVADLVATGT